MKLSTKGRYGAKAMLDLAIHYSTGPVRVKDIAERQQISERYLEQLLISLKVAGMVRSIRGVHGGFALANPPSQTKLSEVIQAMEGSVAPVECVDHPEVCPQANVCTTRNIWVEMAKATSGVLESITLQNLVEWQEGKEPVILKQ